LFITVKFTNVNCGQTLTADKR